MRKDCIVIGTARTRLDYWDQKWQNENLEPVKEVLCVTLGRKTRMTKADAIDRADQLNDIHGHTHKYRAYKVVPLA